MTQKILINTNDAEFAISRSTYTQLIKEHGWTFIGMYPTKELAEAEISRLKGIAESPIPVNITVKTSGQGVVTPMTDGGPALGMDYTYQFTPTSGNKVYSVIIDGVDCGPVTIYTFKRLTRDHTLTVVFSPDTAPTAGNVYAKIFATSGGYVSKKGNALIPTGQNFVFKAQPYPDYKYDKIVINGVEHDLSGIPQGSMLFEETFEAVSEPISIQVYFVPQVEESLPSEPVTRYVWENLYSQWYSNVNARDDPEVISVVENLLSTTPSLAYGFGAQVKIVEIPDNIEWQIKKSCDGSEVVASKFEVWR